MAASAWAVGLTGVRAGMETAVSRKGGDHANGRGAGEPRPPRERGLRALCPPAPPGGERTPAGLRARLRASPVGASLGRAPSASAHRLGPFGAQHVLHLPSGCFSDDLQETMPEKQGAAHSAEWQSLWAGAIPACRSLVGSSDTPGVAVDSTQGACDSVAHRHTAAYSVSDSWRSGQSTPKGPTVSDTFLEANHPPKLHELCPCSAARA